MLRALLCVSCLGGISALAGGCDVASGGTADPPPASADAVAPSTREMAELLRLQGSLANPLGMYFLLNVERAEHFSRLLRRPRALNERLSLRFSVANELLNAGRVDESIQEIQQLEREARTQYNEAKWKESSVPVRLLEAVAHLRRAEIENCCRRNTPDSCLLPIRGEGIHTNRDGSTRAIAVLDDILARFPNNLRARWLLNIAHMTLGSYPDKVPAAQLIPPSVFASEHPLPRFANIARELGVAVHGHAGGAILDDFDEDGRLDLVLSSIGLNDQMRFFRNAGEQGFADATAQAGLTGEVGGLNMIQADYDNDGHLDVLVLRGAWMNSEGRLPLSLLRNDGRGRFEDVTRAAGLLRFAPTQTAVWLDFDSDGWLDLFVGNESSEQATHPCELFHSNRDGTFTEVAQSAGVDFVGFVKAVDSADYDNDGRPDLYLSILGGENVLFRNDGATGGPSGSAWRFIDATAEAGVAAPRHSFGTFFFDYDNDGWEDLFVVGYSPAMAEDVAADYLGLPTQSERGRLYRNNGRGADGKATFSDVTKAAGLYRIIPAMGINHGDLDNDGWLDFYANTGNPDLSTLVPSRMFRNAEGRTFQDVTAAGNFGHLQKGHAVSFGDLDNDGDQDIFAQMGGAYLTDRAYSSLYENPGSPHRWVSLELEGRRTNRCAMGARIDVIVETGSGLRHVRRTVGSGGSFGASTLRQEIGLGEARRIARVEVLWPATRERQDIEGVELDRRYRIIEGVAAPEPLERPSFRAGGVARSSPPPGGATAER